MTEREKLMAVFNGSNTGKIPWYADLSYYWFAMKQKGLLEEKYDGETGYLRFYQDMGAGICFCPPPVCRIEYAGDVECIRQENGNLTVTEFKTPLGIIRQVYQYSTETCSYAPVEHFVKCIDDLRTMVYVAENTVYPRNYSEFKRIDELWGNSGCAIILSPDSVAPIQKLLARWAGVQGTINVMMEDPDEFDELLKRIEDSEDSLFDVICGAPGKIVEFTENMSSEVTGRSFFYKYNLPYYIKRVEQLHKAGKYAGFHFDGSLKGLLPCIKEACFDFAEAMTPAPVGDVELEEMRKLAGDDLIIWGGIPGALFSDLYDEDSFESHIKKVLNVFKDDKKFVLGVADQVPPGCSISRIKKVRYMLDCAGY